MYILKTIANGKLRAKLGFVKNFRHFHLYIHWLTTQNWHQYLHQYLTNKKIDPKGIAGVTK